MDKRIVRKVNMFTNVSEVLTDNAPIVETIPALTALASKFSTALQDIENKMRPLTLDTTGVAKDKRACKEALSLRLSAVCGAMKALAASKSDNTLQAKASFSRSSLFRMRDTELQETAEALIGLANSHAADLLPYGVTAEEISALNDKAQQFKQDNPKVRLTMVTNKTERQLLFDLVASTNGLLREQMDNAVRDLRLSHPDFYDLYQNARRNYIVSIRHDEKEPTAKEASPASVEEGRMALVNALRALLAEYPVAAEEAVEGGEEILEKV